MKKSKMTFKDYAKFLDSIETDEEFRQLNDMLIAQWEKITFDDLTNEEFFKAIRKAKEEFANKKGVAGK